MSDPYRPRPVMLIVLDGWGWREEDADNAVRQARTPAFDALWSSCPHAFLRTSGRDVGLPDGQMGNSEVGHLNLGAGRVVMQELPRIDAACADGSIAALPAFTTLIAKLRESGGTCHLMGLVSPGGVHSHQDHAVALARALSAAGVPVALHAFTDGRDTPPRAAPDYLRKLARDLAPLPGVRIASVIGRYFAMDRDHRWDRVEKAYRAIAEAKGEAHATDPIAAVEAAHARDITDEFIPATVIGDDTTPRAGMHETDPRAGMRDTTPRAGMRDTTPRAGMRDGDGILCFNFRADRVRQLLTALLDPAFDGFARAGERPIRFAAAAGMTAYSAALDRYLAALFPPQPMGDILGEVVARAGLAQLRAAETEKYPHVTYFLNGGREEPFPGEARILVPSPKVATYDLQPEMSAPELTERVVAAIGEQTYDLIVLNYANADMVGHTGSLPAAIAACEAVDAGLGRIAEAIRAAGGALLVTADHGNAELMRDPATGGPHTAHTTNPVPLLLLGGPDGARLVDGRLADVAPTLLALLGLAQPAAMDGRSLLG